MSQTQSLYPVRVALPVPLRRQFDYLAPLPLPQPGCRVRVIFGRQQLIGIVISHPAQSDLPPEKLKPLLEVLDPAPLFGPTLWPLLQWAASYYQHPLGEVLHHALPLLLREGEAPERRPLTGYELTEQGEVQLATPLRRAPRQQQLLERLREGAVSGADLRAEGMDSPILKAVQEKGLIRELDLLCRQEPWLQQLVIHHEDAPRLGAEQAMVVANINQQGGFGVFLLDGVTGSGKTEVYLQIIAPVLARGQQVLVLVPEIGLTPQTLRRFRRRFNAPVLPLHSAMNDRERLESWLACRAGEAAILIGTRSALFTPFAKLGLIIIDEEHDASFKQQEGFRYHARDLAIMRAREEGCPIVLGSATPSLESLQNARSGKYQHLTLKSRAGGAAHAREMVLDIKSLPLQAGVSPQMLDLMAHHLAQGNQVLLFLNRRGYAQSLLCHQCGWIAACGRCDAYYTLHQASRRLQCHHCDSMRAIPECCPECGSPQLQGTGIGTEQVEQLLAERFPHYRTIRIDRDSTRRKGELEAHLDGIRAGEYQILIGTQMLAKGHHFPDVTLVGLLDVDGALFSADFRATEKLAQLYTQVAGRAGRASKPGLVVLQSHHPEHLLLQDLVNNGYSHFAITCLQERQALGLPPFSFQALLRAEARDRAMVEQFMLAITGLLSQRAPFYPELLFIGPLSPQMERRAGKFRMQLLLQSPRRADLSRLLHELLPQIEALPYRQVRWSLDVDPQEWL